MSNIKFIIEVANTHGGDENYLHSLIDEFEKFEGHGIKFQPLHPDRIATSDFEWYKVYQEIFFNENQWKQIIDKSSKTKKVWLDMFDTYSVQILQNNLSRICGIKLQASILYNLEVINALKKIDCTGLKLIINISAIEIEKVTERINKLTSLLDPEELILEVGFQAYPTKLADSGLNKIGELKSKFENKIVFADHIEGKLDDAITLPLTASMLGADYIEKHVMHSSLDTKYDHFSSITVDQYEQLVHKIESYQELLNVPFINQKEIEYLENSIQKPILKNDKETGQLINMSSDLSFKRSAQGGLSVDRLSALLNDKYILGNTKNEGETLKKEDFKKANIATIIAGRLKSSRLKRKALLKIGSLTSVEKCIQSCLQFSSTQHTILATSTTDEDSELKEYTYAPQVIFHQGDPDDVIQRYLDIVNQLKIDVVIRVTADMPYVSEEIMKILLDEHFASGADYTAAKKCSVGTSPEIINVQALRKVKEHFPKADYSEYMTWYFQNNKDHFQVNLVDLPDKFVRDYRLTIDYKEDLTMMNEIENHFNSSASTPGLTDIFNFLDNNKQVAEINNHITLTYKTDKELIDTLNKVTRIKND